MKIHKRTKKLYPSLKERFPWMEYLPRAGWTPEGNKCVVEILIIMSYKLLTLVRQQNLGAAPGQEAAEICLGHNRYCRIL
jgi:hypothetical protein